MSMSATSGATVGATTGSTTGPDVATTVAAATTSWVYDVVNPAVDREANGLMADVYNALIAAAALLLFGLCVYTSLACYNRHRRRRANEFGMFGADDSKLESFFEPSSDEYGDEHTSESSRKNRQRRTTRSSRRSKHSRHARRHSGKGSKASRHRRRRGEHTSTDHSRSPSHTGDSSSQDHPSHPSTGRQSASHRGGGGGGSAEELSDDDRETSDEREREESSSTQTRARRKVERWIKNVPAVSSRAEEPSDMPGLDPSGELDRSNISPNNRGGGSWSSEDAEPGNALGIDTPVLLQPVKLSRASPRTSTPRMAPATPMLASSPRPVTPARPPTPRTTPRVTPKGTPKMSAQMAVLDFPSDPEEPEDAELDGGEQEGVSPHRYAGRGEGFISESETEN